MIVAAGLTPAWQQILRFDGFGVGEVNRARDAHWCASGKVLNVAVALAHLGCRCEVVALVGGAPRARIEDEFGALGIRARWVETRSATRICTTILDCESGIATELVENAGPVTAGELEAFSGTFANAAASAEIVVLTGSLPPGTPATYYRELLAVTRCRAVLDIRGDELFAALECRPFLAKPNRKELAHSLGRPLDSESQIRGALQELNDRGAQWAVVTDGPGPVWASSHGKCYRFRVPQVQVINPIGSGDCLAAGIAWGLADQREPLEAIAIGLAAAVENARQLLPARLDLAQVLAEAENVVAEQV